MNLETFRGHCLAKKGVTEEMPFGDQALVYKVMGKMFAITEISNFSSISLKVDPEKAIELREMYDAVQPGYHLNKKHWNSVTMDGTIPDKLILEWLQESYELVVQGLTKKDKSALDRL